MRIVCLGGGPAGLYFSILMKKADPSCHVKVVERNRADDTFGWGVVFSDQTMDGFREADPVRWSSDRAQRSATGTTSTSLQGHA
jgi:anthraniloyl-CoA monooxygenase